MVQEDEEAIAGEIGEPLSTRVVFLHHMPDPVRRAIEHAQREKLVLARRGEKRAPTVLKTGGRPMLLGITGNAGRIVGKAIADHGLLNNWAKQIYDLPALEDLSRTHRDIEISGSSVYIHLRRKKPSEIFIQREHLPPEVRKALARIKFDIDFERDIHFPVAVKLRGKTLGLFGPMRYEKAVWQLARAISQHGLIHEKHLHRYHLPSNLQRYSPILLSKNGLTLLRRRKSD